MNSVLSSLLIIHTDHYFINDTGTLTRLRSLYHEQNQFMINIRRSPIVSKLPMALFRSLYHTFLVCGSEIYSQYTPPHFSMHAFATTFMASI